MFTIRQATTNDCNLIYKLAQEVFAETYRSILTSEQIDYMMEWMYAPINIKKQIDDEGHIYFIGYDDTKEAAGYVSIQLIEKDLFHLQKIYALPKYQRKHFGSFLFKEAIKYIKNIHPQPCTIELNVNRYNEKAINFYSYMGMQKVREGDFSIGNGYYMNDFIMSISV